jgi:uncharacterized protein
MLQLPDQVDRELSGLAPPIVLIGASVRAAAQSARRAGFRVTGVDLFGDVDTLAACEQHRLLSEITAQELRTAPLVLQVGGLADTSLLRELPPHMVCDPQMLSDPALLGKIARAAGILVPPTLLARDFAEAATGRWLTKKRDSCGGLGVQWWQGTGRPLKERGTPADEQVIQQWIPGRLLGASFLSNGREVEFLGVCRGLFKRTHVDDVRLPFVYAGSLGPLPISTDLRGSLWKVGQEVLAATGLRGLFNVDLIQDAAGALWLLEINPRWSGSSELIERSLIECQLIEAGSSLISHTVRAMAGLPIGLTMQRTNMQHLPSFYLKRIIFARRAGQFAMHRIEALVGQQATAEGRGNVSFHDLPAEGAVLRQGWPVLTVIERRQEKVPMKTHRDLVRSIRLAIESRLCL